MSTESALHAQPPIQAAPTSFTYDAFLSYNHQDRAVAAGIQKAMHHIGRRVGQLRALRVFRDSTDLTASPNLWGKVRDAMDRCRYLIVVLSPQAAASHWVDREVGYWLERRGPEQLMFVVAGGRLRYDERSARFDPEGSDAAVPVLTRPGVLASEPFYVDVSVDAPWDARAPLFREKVTDLAAPIHGKPKDQLASEDLREQHRFRRLRNAAIAVLVVLTVIAVAAAVVAVVQWQEAIRKRNEAIASRLVSEAQSMLAGARPGGEVRGLQQLLAGNALTPAHAQGALLDAAVAGQAMLKVIATTGNDRTRLAFSLDGRRVVTGTGDGTVRVWDIASGQPVGGPMTGDKNGLASVAFSPDGQRVASGGATDGAVRVWDVASGQQIGPPLTRHIDDAVASVAFKSGRAAHRCRWRYRRDIAGMGRGQRPADRPTACPPWSGPLRRLVHRPPCEECGVQPARRPHRLRR